KRLGEEPHTTINEMKAEIMFRPLLPSIIEKKGVEGTKEQWAIATLASALQQVHDQPEDADDDYFAAGVYSLNTLFKEGVVIQEEEKFRITDYDSYYAVLTKDALEIKALYENADMT